MKKLLTILLLMLVFSGYAQKKKINYKRFSGTITVISEDAIKYDGEILILYDIEPKLRPVFESGILFPALLKGATANPIPTPSKPVAADEITHNFTIKKFQFVRPRSKSGKIRKFKFLLYQKDIKDPTEYFVELWNPKASLKTEIRKFIRGCRLKAIKRGRVVV